jgi:hypothetical protein
MSDLFEQSNDSEPDDPESPRRIKLSQIPRRARDQKLWEMLPCQDEPYDSSRLSPAEFSALEEALCDGFGARLSSRISGIRLPAGIESGLPSHRFYATQHPAEELDPDDERNDWEFWGYGDYDSDGPPPAEHFPLGFHPIRLRIYFRNQFDRFCFHINNQEMGSACDLIEDEDILALYGWEQLYEKPWYEMHALQYLDWLEHPDNFRNMNVSKMMVTDFAGTLGRLVEQYYWRFRYEEPAKTGLGARGGASAGGWTHARKKQKKSAPDGKRQRTLCGRAAPTSRRMQSPRLFGGS